MKFLKLNTCRSGIHAVDIHIETDLYEFLSLELECALGISILGGHGILRVCIFIVRTGGEILRIHTEYRTIYWKTHQGDGILIVELDTYIEDSCTWLYIEVRILGVGTHRILIFGTLRVGTLEVRIYMEDGILEFGVEEYYITLLYHTIAGDNE